MRIRCTALAVGALFIGSIAGCSGSAKPAGGTGGAAQSTTIRCSTSSPVGGGDYQAVEVFAKAVEAKTNGQVRVKIFPDSQLGDYESALQQIRAGSLACLYESMGTLGTFSPIASLEAVPYLYPDVDGFAKVWDGDIGASIFADVEKSTGFHLEGPAFRGFRQLAVNKPVNQIGDLKGLKLRVPGIPAYVNGWKALGANPTPLPFPETFAALQQKIVDGVENPLSSIRDQKFNEVTKYLVMTNHMAETMAFVFQSQAFAGYDKATQAAIHEAAAESATWYRKYTADTESKIKSDFASHGTTVIEPDLTGFRDSVRGYDPGPELRPYVAKIRQLLDKH